MSIEETIEQSVEKAVAPLREKLDLLLSAIAVQQKDAAVIAGVTSDTVRNKAIRGDIEILQRPGSRLNFVTLTEASNLKPKRTKRR